MVHLGTRTVYETNLAKFAVTEKAIRKGLVATSCWGSRQEAYILEVCRALANVTVSLILTTTLRRTTSSNHGKLACGIERMLSTHQPQHQTP